MRPRLKIEIKAQGYIFPQDRPVYQAFPTITQTGPARLLVGFRQGRVVDGWTAEFGDHGDWGDVYLAESIDDGRTFGPPRLVVDHAWEKTNEHDALLTALDQEEVLLITRSHGPAIFSSYWSLSQDGGQTFPPRRPLDLGLGPLAFFGHALPDPAKGGCLLSFYAQQPDSPRPGAVQPGVARLRLDGSSLELVGWIWEGELDHCYLNETGLVRLADGRLLALIRQEPPEAGLQAAFSQDGGQTWSQPRSVGLLGEAPSPLLLPDGRILVIYRGLTQAGLESYVGLALSEDEGQTWSQPWPLVAYTGGRYHGGYGDLALTESGDVLAVYYLAQAGESPRVAWSRVRVGG